MQRSFVLLVPLFLTFGCFMQGNDGKGSGSDTEGDTEGTAGVTSVTTAGTGGPCHELDCDTEDGVEDESTGAGTEDTGSTGPSVMFCNSPDGAIPDGDIEGVSDVIEVPDMGLVTDVNVNVRIYHGFVGNLRVELGHGGSTIFLIDHPLDGTCQGGDVEAMLDDEAEASVEDSCANETPAMTGAMSPSGPLSFFDALSMSGPWELTVTDDVADNEGVLNAWCITIEYE